MQVASLDVAAVRVGELRMKHHCVRWFGDSCEEQERFNLADMADKVEETGYKSHSKNFRNVVYQCLYDTEGMPRQKRECCVQCKGSAAD